MWNPCTVSTTIICVDPTQIVCEHTNLVAPPHHLRLEVWQVHPHLEEPKSSVYPISKSNITSSPIVSGRINYFHGPQQLAHHCHLIDCFDGPQHPHTVALL